MPTARHMGSLLQNQPLLLQLVQQPKPQPQPNQSMNVYMELKKAIFLDLKATLMKLQGLPIATNLLVQIVCRWLQQLKSMVILLELQVTILVQVLQVQVLLLQVLLLEMVLPCRWLLVDQVLPPVPWLRCSHAGLSPLGLPYSHCRGLGLAGLVLLTLLLTDSLGLCSGSHVASHSQRSQRSVEAPPHDHPSPNIDFHNNNRHRHQSSHEPYSSSGNAASSTSSTYWSLSEYFYHNIVNISLPGHGGGPGDLPSSCLVSYNISRDICDRTPVKDRYQLMRSLSLVFCGSGFPLYHMVGDGCHVTGSSQECRACFDSVEQLDRDVHSMFCHFEQILAKTDCLTNYSTHWNCNDCKVSNGSFHSRFLEWVICQFWRISNFSQKVHLLQSSN